MTMKLSTPTRVLHWGVAVFMIGLLVMGLIMKYTEWYAVYDLHKSLGLLALFFIVPRVMWRLFKGWPAPVNTRQQWEQTAAKVVHWVLIAATVLMPISGIMLSGYSGHGFGFFGLVLVHENFSLTEPGVVVPHNETLAAIGYGVHQWLGFTLAACIVLHIAGAIKHHVVYKDDTLKRMTLSAR